MNPRWSAELLRKQSDSLFHGGRIPLTSSECRQSFEPASRTIFAPLSSILAQSSIVDYPVLRPAPVFNPESSPKKRQPVTFLLA